MKPKCKTKIGWYKYKKERDLHTTQSPTKIQLKEIRKKVMSRALWKHCTSGSLHLSWRWKWKLSICHKTVTWWSIPAHVYRKQSSRRAKLRKHKLNIKCMDRFKSKLVNLLFVPKVFLDIKKYNVIQELMIHELMCIGKNKRYQFGIWMWSIWSEYEGKDCVWLKCKSEVTGVP